MKQTTQTPAPVSGFNEITFTDGEAEVMAHKTARGWSRVYAYARDVAGNSFPPSWKWEAGRNPLFVDLVWPRPSVAVNSLRQRGFVATGDDEAENEA